MRITADQTIADYPAVRVRQLIRQTARTSITLRHVRQVLRCSDSGAASVLNQLEKDGFIESVSGRLEPSTKGRALAMATAARPLRRTTAARLVADLIERARSVNSDDSWAYRVETLAVFGSYVRGADRPSDVDIACELRPRWKSARQQAHEQVRREDRGKPFRNISEWASWPKLEVFRYPCTRYVDPLQSPSWRGRVGARYLNLLRFVAYDEGPQRLPIFQVGKAVLVVLQRLVGGDHDFVTLDSIQVQHRLADLNFWAFGIVTTEFRQLISVKGQNRPKDEKLLHLSLPSTCVEENERGDDQYRPKRRFQSRKVRELAGLDVPGHKSKNLNGLSNPHIVGKQDTFAPRNLGTRLKPLHPVLLMGMKTAVLAQGLRPFVAGGAGEALGRLSFGRESASDRFFVGINEQVFLWRRRLFRLVFYYCRSRIQSGVAFIAESPCRRR